ncbi:putative ribokinase [Entomophthora muscae]|uniref:Ribokinase n=2 Tax=Entomophthora muscae TaxID=34485 RepID=A0ACC2U7U3_9FUNG|nr:putative ribokinase [Entomophthora muscae]
MSAPRVLSFGSVNIDHVYSVDDFNRAGETKAAQSYTKLAGGKGANQSVALAKAGAGCFHAGKIGTDGEFIREFMVQAGVDCTHLISSPTTTTGTAFIQVSEKTKQNSILIWGGGNSALTKAEVDTVFKSENEKWSAQDWLVVQNELSLTPYIVEKASERGMKVVYNPAPMDADLMEAISWDKVDVLVLNESEAIELLDSMGGDLNLFPSDLEDYTIEHWTFLATEISSAKFSLSGVDWIVITLGSKGAVSVRPTSNGDAYYSPAAALPAPLKDTTGAGDTFLGFLVSYLASHASVKTRKIPIDTMGDAIKFAAAASALAVTRAGAMQSIPSISDVIDSFPALF